MGDKAKGRKKGGKSRAKDRSHDAKAAGPAGAGSSTFHIPADLRETGAKLMAAATSPAGREMLAAGIAIAATAAQAALRNTGGTAGSTATKPAEPADKGTRPADTTPGGTTRAPDPQAIAATIGTVAESLFAHFARPRKG